jgi:hypothetical protein
MTDNERAYKISGRSRPGPKPPKPRFSTFYEIQGMGIPMKTWRGSITEEARHKPYPTKILVRGNRSPSPEPKEETKTPATELVIVITPPAATAVDAATVAVKQEPVTVEEQQEEECKTPVPSLLEDMEEEDDETPDAAPPSFLDDGLTSPERLRLFNDIYSAMDDSGKMLPPSPFKPHVCINVVDAEVPSLVTFDFNSQFSPS